MPLNFISPIYFFKPGMLCNVNATASEGKNMYYFSNTVQDLFSFSEKDILQI